MAKLYDIRAKIGEYEKDGETKGRYVTIGAVVQTKAGAKMIKLDTIPVSWERFAYLSEPLKQKESGTSNSDSNDIVPDGISGEPVSLDSIPF